MSRSSYAVSSTSSKEIRSVLSVCDNSMISDAAYHELAMLHPMLPRTNHIVSCRNELNREFETKRTPGLLPGAYLSLKDEIINYVTELKLQSLTLPDTLKIKISGDGARVSRVSNFIIVSFSVLSESCSSHINQRVLAIVNSDANYSNLSASLAPLLGEINNIYTDGHVIVNDTNISVATYVGGDMKFLQLLLGINSSIAVYACPWCKVAKQDRADMSHELDYYHQDKFKRTVSEMKKSVSTSVKNKYGSKKEPLLNIEPEHYLPDELHLMMRITDVLLRNLIDDACSKDQLAKLNGQATDNMKLLAEAIQSCGLVFRTWISKTGELEYTSLTGTDKKKMLESLPGKLMFCIHEDTRERVIKLWRDFQVIYTTVTSAHTTPEDSVHIFERARAFVNDFLEIGLLKREGYHKKNVTPYIHVLVYHVPYFVGIHGSLAKFSGQGVEKTNDIIKQIHQTKSNKQDATMDALICRKRLEKHHSEQFHRPKRKYEKSNEQFWTFEKSANAKCRKQRIIQEQVEANNSYMTLLQPDGAVDIDTMSVVEMKEMLVRMGIKTKLRKKEKIAELLRNSL